ncbi:MAG: hypothetical protein WDN69_33175 [Aliidongia sp.]
MQALTELTGGRARFAGIGGECMAALGLDSLVPIRDWRSWASSNWSRLRAACCAGCARRRPISSGWRRPRW